MRRKIGAIYERARALCKSGRGTRFVKDYVHISSSTIICWNFDNFPILFRTNKRLDTGVNLNYVQLSWLESSGTSMLGILGTYPTKYFKPRMVLIFCFLTFRYVLHFSSSLIAIVVSGALLLHKTRRTTLEATALLFFASSPKIRLA